MLAREMWIPQIGPQTRALDSEADELYYGGEAGGGKTDLLIGAAIRAHRKSIIYRRQHTDLVKIVDRARTIVGHSRGYNGQLHIWRRPDARFPEGWQLDFGGCPHLGDERKYQGWDHDLKGFDELPHFLEAQYHYLCGWNRSDVQGQRCRIVATGNPPMTAEGEWVTKRWEAWLDPAHERPAAEGELRWHVRLPNGEEVEVGGPDEAIRFRGEEVRPRSRTFVRSGLRDNTYYGADYFATIASLPEPLRSQLMGDFAAGREDDAWQVIPTAWVVAAQNRWEEGSKPDRALDSIGVDVARGGGDETVLTLRFGGWFAEQACFPGRVTPSGPHVAALIAKAYRKTAMVQIDVGGGYGGAVVDALPDGISYASLNGAEASGARDRTGKLGFRNKRAEWWWRMREALDPDSGDGLMIPPDRRLRADLCAPRWKLTASGVQIEAKEEIVKRLGRSPDRGESLVYALVGSALESLGDEAYGITERPGMGGIDDFDNFDREPSTFPDWWGVG